MKFGLKRMHVFLLRDYLMCFVATLLVCIFVLLMQSLWRYIDDLVGKGLGMDVLAQFFYYAALTVVPMALPLSILLSSLMCFGGLGERLELIAMKAAGISLFRIMKPLIIVMCILSVASFYFSNVVMPDVQVKWTVLMRSIRSKSPDVSIPVGSFYNGIENYSIYVRRKNPETKMMYDMMIYDFTKGNGTMTLENMRIVTADSGTLVSTADKLGFIMKLYSGETFENLKNSGIETGSTNVPFRRETFTYRELMLDYDTNMNMVSEESVSSRQNTKNLEELTHAVDSLRHESDSLSQVFSDDIVWTKMFGRVRDSARTPYTNLDTVPRIAGVSYRAVIDKRSLSQLKESYEHALMDMRHTREELDFWGDRKFHSADKMMWRHDIERHRKFTLSFACFIFFFIGAPLGAIIRKGGFGQPIVISTFIFIFYYIVDNMGYKWARNGTCPVWIGMWMSSAMLFPFGIYLTYKAAIDASFNMPSMSGIKSWASKNWGKVKRIIGIRNNKEQRTSKELIE